MAGRLPFTAKEDEHLYKYIAKQRPEPSGRMGNRIYLHLVSNPDKWPWGKQRTWQSWRERYKKRQHEFDEMIRRWQAEHGIEENVGERDPGSRHSSQKVPFTSNEDKLLVKFIAKYNPQLDGRNGNQLYKVLVENKSRLWNWSAAHTWQSWRHRYISKREDFDRRISEYIERHDIPVPLKLKWPGEYRTSGRPAERQKRATDLEELDTQEEQLAKLAWSSPVRGDGIGHRSTQPRSPPAIKEEPDDDTVNVNGSGLIQAQNSVQNSANGGRKLDQDVDEENEPPGSEDYDGEIFENDAGKTAPTEDDERPRNATDNQNDEVDRAAEPSSMQADIQRTEDQPSAVITGSIQPTAISNPLESPATKSPLKTHPGTYRNDFTLSRPRRRQDEDPFEDFPLSPKRERLLPVAKRRPPTLKEDAFGNRLNKRPRKVHESSTEHSDTDTDDQMNQCSWPPKRKRPKIAHDHSSPRMNGDDVKSQPKDRLRDKGKAKSTHHIVLEASPQDPQRRPVHATSSLEDISPQVKKSSRPAVGTSDGPKSGSITIDPVKRATADIFAPSPVDNSISKIHSVDLSNDSTSKNSSAFINKPSTSRVINFRSLEKPIRRSSSRASVNSLVLEEDSLVLQELGIQMAVKMFSQEFGFTEEVIQELWNQLKSLRLLKDALTDMKQSAERSRNAWLEGASKLSPSVSLPRRSSPKSEIGAKVPPHTSARMSTSAPVSASKQRRVSTEVAGKSLEFRPVDPQDASVSVDLEYEPLTGTRAGKYARLAKQGREHEALEREQRRVSSVAFSPRRDLHQHENSEEPEPNDSGQEAEDGMEETEEKAEIRVPDGNADEEQDGEDQKHAASEHAGEASIRSKDQGQDPLAEDELVCIKSESLGADGAGSVRTHAQKELDRWQELENLLYAANRQDLHFLRKFEEGFDPGERMRWLGDQVAFV